MHPETALQCLSRQLQLDKEHEHILRQAMVSAKVGVAFTGSSTRLAAAVLHLIEQYGRVAYELNRQSTATHLATRLMHDELSAEDCGDILTLLFDTTKESYA